MTRIVIAGILGGIAMFIWSSVAHVATPLGSVGISQIPNEAPLLSAMTTAIGDKSGLYMFPWVDPNDPDMMAKSAAAVKIHPSGILIYTPTGKGMTSMTVPLIEEFLKEMAIALIAAWLVSMAAITGFAQRVLFVSAIGACMAMTTNLSYFFWYSFPLSNTLAAMLIEFGEMVFAGVAIAWWFGRKPA